MSSTLEQGLIVLVFTAIVVLVVLTVYVVRVLINLFVLTKKLDETTTILNSELEPTIKELNQVLVNVNKIADSADAHMTSAKNVIAKILGAAGVALSGLKAVSGSFFKGFSAALKIFMKK